MSLIGYLYIGAYEYKNFPLNSISQDKRINENISDISKLLTLSLAKFEQTFNAINMINIFADILKHKDHFCLTTAIMWLIGVKRLEWS